jgi:flagellin
LENSAAAGLITIDDLQGGAGDAIASAFSVQNFIDGSSEPQTTFKFTLKDSSEIYGEATVAFSESSGSTTVKLGDVSFTVDNAEMFNGDTEYNAQEIGLTIENLIRFTDSDGNYTEATMVDGTVSEDKVFGGVGNWYDKDNNAIVNDNQITLDIDTRGIGKGGFVRGNTYNINVSSIDNYQVQLKMEDAEAPGSYNNIGEAYKFTNLDWSDPSTFNNVALGLMNSGLFVNLDRDVIAALANGESAEVTFTVDESENYTAQVQKADGTVIDGMDKITLNASAAEGNINLGKGVVFNYDGTKLAALDEDGGQHYFSIKEGEDQFEMVLTKLAFGQYGDVQVGDKVEFSKGDTVYFEGVGLSIRTDDTIASEVSTSFDVKVETIVEDTVEDNSLAMQIGANYGQSMRIDVSDMRAAAIGVSGGKGQAGKTVIAKSGAMASFTETMEVTDGTTSEGAEYALDVSSHEKASAAIDVISGALEKVSAERSKLGSFQNRLEHTISNLGTSAENLQAAESRIRDVDMAQEMMEFTKNNILQQAAQAMLAQANQQPQGVLQLLR